jgi:hypothetical protein
MTSRHSHLFDFTYEEKPVELEREIWSGDAIRGLVCPHCGSGYLHHYGFTDYERDEDAKVENIVDCGSVLFDDKGQRSSVFGRSGCSPGMIGGNLQVFSDLHDNRNPSNRRDGIVIKFWCEECTNISLLCIQQHKGCSYIHWRAVKVYPKNKKRKTIKPKLRFDILERDKYTCQACGATPHDGATLEIDHIQPFSKGGTDDLDNLQVLCRECNSGKGAR